MLPGDFPLKLQIISMLSSTHDNIACQVSVEEDLGAALNIEDMLIHMSSAGYYGQGHEGFTSYGCHTFGCGPLENGDDLEQFLEANPLHRQYPGEGHDF